MKTTTEKRKLLDGIVSAIFAINGYKKEPAYKLQRKSGTKNYNLVISDENGGDINVFDLIEKSGLNDFLVEAGIKSTWNDFISEYASELALDFKLNAIRKNGFTESSKSIISYMAWEVCDDLAKHVWPIISKSEQVSDRYNWCSQLRKELSGQFNDTSKDKVLDILRRIIKSRPGWDYSSGLFVLSWASNEQWSELLIKTGFSCRHRVNDRPLFADAVFNEERKMILTAASIECGGGVWRNPPESVPDKYSEIGDQHSTPTWFYACAAASIETINFIINKDPDIVNFKDVDGKNCLHYAAMTGREDVVDFLIKKGCDPTLEDNDGNRPAEFVPVSMDELYNKINKNKI